MKYLIDTHILIWLAVSPEVVSKTILEIIENPSNEIYISTVSLWEIAIKLSIKKLDLQGLEISDLVNICNEQGITIVQLPITAVQKYRNLPMKEKHRDPFDRALIALCISDGYVFLSHDSKVEQYEQDGLVFIS
ncbi:MAG: type II toxin-antitoxin system VapC family toxin [Spirochaetaceae bacterium]|nr:type II toxin-antitoxin system VapC family toxin [Spirochaetaceae bacterium]